MNKLTLNEPAITVQVHSVARMFTGFALVVLFWFRDCVGGGIWWVSGCGWVGGCGCVGAC